MILFVLLAGALALITGAYLGAVLWRASARRAAIAVVLGVLVGSGALYLHWSDWHWPQPSVEGNDPGMIARLARRLERQPNDVDGWLLLARSHAAIGQYPLAQRAYQRALRLEEGRNVEALIGLGELLVVQAQGEVGDRAARFFEQALQLDPDSERALFFGAVAAQRRGEVRVALERFERMLAKQPPENIQAILRQQIATLRAAASSPTPVPADASASAPRIQVRVSVSPELSARVSGGATLFVFVRRPGVPGPPLAVKRLPAQLPQTVVLTSADSMVPGLTFSSGESVEVSAKLSADGSATPRRGDPIGRLTYTVGRDAERTLVIDGLSP